MSRTSVTDTLGRPPISSPASACGTSWRTDPLTWDRLSIGGTGAVATAPRTSDPAPDFGWGPLRVQRRSEDSSSDNRASDHR